MKINFHYFHFVEKLEKDLKIEKARILNSFLSSLWIDLNLICFYSQEFHFLSVIEGLLCELIFAIDFIIFKVDFDL